MRRRRPAPGAAANGTPRRRAGGPEPVVGDRFWSAGARWGIAGAVAGLALAVLTDWATGGLTPLRAVLWAVLGGVALVLFVPPRVTAGEGWLEVAGPLRRRRVRTDLLVLVRRSGALAVRLDLYDAYGGWVELDPQVLAANPLLWHRFDADARRARQCGVLRRGADVLRELDERISGDQARAVFRASGL